MWTTDLWSVYLMSSVVAGACPPPSTQTRVWSTERSRCRRSKGTGLMERLCLLAALYWLNEAMTFKWNSPENPRSKQPVYFDIGLLPRSWKVNLLVYFQTRGVSLFIFYRHTLIRIYSDPKSWSQFQYIFAFWLCEYLRDTYGLIYQLNLFIISVPPDIASANHLRGKSTKLRRCLVSCSSSRRRASCRLETSCTRSAARWRQNTAYGGHQGTHLCYCIFFTFEGGGVVR